MNTYLKTLDAFADLLAACNVIDEAAVHDAVDYDGEVTLGNIAIAHRRLMAEETADSICESLKLERDEARDAANKAKAYKRVLKETNAQLKRERDEARAEMIRWMSIAEGRGRTEDDDTGKAMANLIRQRDEARKQRDRLAGVIEAASVLIAAKGRHNTMLAYNGLRDALQSLTQNSHE